MASVTADYALVYQPGYPFALDFLVAYTLDERGLTTDFAVINQSEEEVPYGVGPIHIWLLVLLRKKRAQRIGGL